MLQSVLHFVSYQDIIELTKAFPQLEEKVISIKHKKGKKMLNELDDQLEKWRLKLETRECVLEYLLNMGVCHQHYKSTTLKIYRALTKIMKVEKRKMDLLNELCIEDHASNQELVYMCYLCNTIFPSSEIARSHLIDLSEECFIKYLNIIDF